ncbi:MAG: hypothetical protein FJZ01_26365 [Candidatus Sericytochromatia bacterium]|nr:hypothetical protein [Candidatus Tanganyikabacteria bacterium]
MRHLIVYWIAAAVIVGCSQKQGGTGGGQSPPSLTWKGPVPEVTRAQIDAWPAPPPVRIGKAEAIDAAGGEHPALPGAGAATLDWAFMSACHDLPSNAQAVSDNLFLRCPRFGGLTEIQAMRYPFWVVAYRGDFGPCPTGPGHAVRMRRYVDASTGAVLASVPLCGDRSLLAH